MERPGQELAGPRFFFSRIACYPDIICLQEVGGEAGQDHWTTKAFIAKGLAAFYRALVFTPSKGLRGVAIVLRNHLLDSLKDVCMLQAGMGLELQLHGMRAQVINVHFRHPKRVDASSSWNGQKIGEFSSKLRYFDKFIVLGDFKLDLQMPCEGEQLRSVAIRSLIGLHGMGLRCIDQDTWFARGLSSRIVFILDSFEDDTLWN